MDIVPKGRRKNMQYTAEDIERLMVRANAFINGDNDEEDIEDAQRFLNRLEKAVEQGNEARIAVNVVDLRHKIKGTRISVSLTAEEEHHAQEVAQTLADVFAAYPTLSIPRERTLDNILASVVTEMKNIKKEAQK
jgi:hypothetical protein